MTVTERLMKPGSFSVRLREGHPWSEGAAVGLLDHIVITPTHLDPISGFSDANILASSIYTGVVTSKPSPRIFEGYDPSWWLGTPDGLGEIRDNAITRSGATLSTWVNGLLPASIVAGSISNTGLGTHDATYVFVCPREELDAVCQALGAEWRVNPDFTLDAAKSPDLFVSSPTTVITRKEEGQDGVFRGLDGNLIVTGRDVEQYTTKVIATASGWGAGVGAAVASGSTSYKDPWNNTVVLERVVDVPTESLANASLIASAQLGQWNRERLEVAVSSRTYNVTRHAKPGDYVYMFDQLAQLTDAANQIIWRGEVISPIKLRVYALTWPIEQGMGVYVRRSGATPTYTDLTDFIEWEDGTDVVWDVGAAPRASNDVDASKAGATAYLGANAAVAERVSSGGSRSTYTPVLTATTTNPNIGSTGIAEGEYQVVNGRCTGRATIYAQGAGISAGSGSYRISLPVAAAYLPSTSIAMVGYGALYIGNPAAGMHPIVLDATPSTTTARILGEGFEASSALAGGFGAAGNCLWITFDYPVA